MLGSSKYQILSEIDLKDVFHSLRITEELKKYCGILPHFGSASYMYQRMPMDLNIFPASCSKLVISVTEHLVEVVD